MTLPFEILTGDPSEEEAAAIAAVLITLQRVRHTAPEPAPAQVSGWLRAARRESLARAPHETRQGYSSLWRG